MRPTLSEAMRYQGSKRYASNLANLPFTTIHEISHAIRSIKYVPAATHLATPSATDGDHGDPYLLLDSVTRLVACLNELCARRLEEADSDGSLQYPRAIVKRRDQVRLTTMKELNAAGDLSYLINLMQGQSEALLLTVRDRLLSSEGQLKVGQSNRSESYTENVTPLSNATVANKNMITFVSSQIRRQGRLITQIIQLVKFVFMTQEESTTPQNSQFNFGPSLSDLTPPIVAIDHIRRSAATIWNCIVLINDDTTVLPKQRPLPYEYSQMVEELSSLAESVFEIFSNLQSSNPQPLAHHGTSHPVSGDEIRQAIVKLMGIVLQHAVSEISSAVVSMEDHRVQFSLQSHSALLLHVSHLFHSLSKLGVKTRGAEQVFIQMSQRIFSLYSRINNRYQRDIIVGHIFHSNLLVLQQAVDKNQTAFTSQVLKINRDVISPLIPITILDPLPNSTVIHLSARILSNWFLLMDEDDRRELACEMARVGLLHSLLTHMSRLTRLANGEETTHTNCYSKADCIKSLIEIIASILTNTNEFGWDKISSSEWVQWLTKICEGHFGFPQLCQWALMTFVRLHGSVLTNDNFTSNQGDQADVNFVDVCLSLIYRWMESYIATNRLNDNEISIIFAVKLLEGMLQMNHNSRLSNKQLINSCNILMLCETVGHITISSMSRENLLLQCSGQSWSRDEIMRRPIWQWVWRVNGTKATKELHQVMINCVLSDKPSLLNDNLSLTEVGDWLIKVGVTAYRAVIDYMNITLMEMRGQVDSSQTRSHIEKLQTALAIARWIMTQSNDAGIWIALDVMTTIETLIQMKIHTTSMIDGAPFARVSGTIPLMVSSSNFEMTLQFCLIDVCRLAVKAISIETIPNFHLLIQGMIDMLERHATSYLMNLHLHLKVVEFLSLLIDDGYAHSTPTDRFRVIQLLSTPRVIQAMHWVVNHLPGNEKNHQHSLTNLEQFFKTPHGERQEKDVEEGQLVEIKLQVQFVRFVNSLVRLSQEKERSSDRPLEFRESDKSNLFLSLLHPNAITFLTMQPHQDLKVAIFRFLSTCLELDVLNPVMETSDHCQTDRPTLSSRSIRMIAYAIQAEIFVNIVRPTHSNGQMKEARSAAILCWRWLIRQVDSPMRKIILCLPWNGLLVELFESHPDLSGDPALLSDYFTFTATMAGWYDMEHANGETVNQSSALQSATTKQMTHFLSCANKLIQTQPICQTAIKQITRCIEKVRKKDWQKKITHSPTNVFSTAQLDPLDSQMIAPVVNTLIEACMPFTSPSLQSICNSSQCQCLHIKGSKSALDSDSAMDLVNRLSRLRDDLGHRL